ncbi:MAG: DUF4331 domain-containing protein [Halioglobus sp.]|nr:DUF4331 domain-containing protein [Halioglobus sp.]
MNNSRIIAATIALCASSVALASSHREAPFITKYPQVDATDFYLFRSYEPGREDYVTMIANYIPLQSAYGGPNYFPLDSEALYEILVDNNGDAVEDITFQFRFSDEFANGDSALTVDVDGMSQSAVLRNIAPISAGSEPGLSHTQSYALTMIDGDRRTGSAVAINAAGGESKLRKPFDYSGTKTYGAEGGYTPYARSFIKNVDIPGCAAPARVFAGQRYEAFKISLGEVFDLVNFVPIDGDSAPGAGDGGGFPGGVTQDPARNVLAYSNVTSLALEVHRDCLTGDGPVIGAWTTASLPQANELNRQPTLSRPEVGGGPYVQVSRLSAPLVNELVIGYDRKDTFNASEPQDDGQFLSFVTNPVLPVILSSLFLEPVNATLGTSLNDLAPTNYPRDDLVAAFLTGFADLNQFASGAAGEMLRLNTDIAPTPRAQQQPLGVAAGDLAGFPNGRRPGDDVVDIALRVVMGALCYDLPIGSGGAPVNLGLCSADDAPVGDVAFTDGAPLSARDLDNRFPYLLSPYPGSPVNAALPTPED